MNIFELELYLKQKCKDYNMSLFVEYKFHPKRKWRFDYAIPELMIAIEYEGGIFKKGRHVRGKGYTDDCEKYNEAALRGWKVLRFTTITKNYCGIIDQIFVK